MDNSTENSMIFFQVFDMVDIGLVILDKDLRISLLEPLDAAA